MEWNEDPSKKDWKVHETVCVFWWRWVFFWFIWYFTQSMQNKQAKVKICPQCWSGIPVFWRGSLCIPCTRLQKQSQKSVDELTQAVIKVAHIWAVRASEVVKNKTEAKSQTKSQNKVPNPRKKRSWKKLTKSVGHK